MTTRVMFFCLGNICRSPLGQGLFEHLLEQRGLADEFHVESSGTGAYHIGELPDPGSRRVAKRRVGLDLSDQRAQQLTSEHLAEFDYLVAMSASNLRNARALPGAEDAPFLLLRDFEPDPALRDRDVPDPWSKGEEAFDEVFDIVERCCEGLLEHILEEREGS